MAVHIRVRVEALDALAERDGLASRYALAQRLNVSQPTVRRILNGEQAPGEKFIGAVMHTFDVPFDAVFEVVADPVDTGVCGVRQVPPPRSDWAPLRSDPTNGTPLANSPSEGRKLQPYWDCLHGSLGFPCGTGKMG